MEGSPRGFKREEAEPWFDQPFDEPMILFDEIVELLDLPQFTGCWNGTDCLEFVERLGEKSLGGLSIAAGAELELQRIPC